MYRINNNYLKLENNYLFSKIAEEKQNYLRNNPEKELIDLSIGDVTLPLVSSVQKGIKNGLELLSCNSTFSGYPPASGHDFLKNKILNVDYKNIPIDLDELFISDSSKGDITHILDILDNNLNVAIQDPVYPVYVDSNIIRGNNIIFYDSIEEIIEKKLDVDIIYICNPNNPTGKLLPRETLEKIVSYALNYNILIFYDSAYEAFIQDKNAIHSIYEIKDAKKVAIEFRSFSKTAGYTPLRLAYTIVPKEISNLNILFKRLKSTKYNGPSYLSEYGIYSVYKDNNLHELKENISYYLKNTQILNDYFYFKGMTNEKEVNSPYVWINVKNDSWDYFYYLLNNFGIVCTPGSGFGKNGKTYIRLTGFNTFENTLKAIDILKKDLK